MVNEGSLIEVRSDLCLLNSLFGRRTNARTKPIIPQVPTDRNPWNPIHRSISRISIPFEDCNKTDDSELFRLVMFCNDL
jgi:hypothetical protein